MGTAGKVSKTWKPIKLHRKLKLVSYCEKLKPVKLLAMFSHLMGKLFPPTVSLPRYRARCEDPWTQEELAFVTVVVKVNPRKRGWQRAIRSLLNKCQGARFNMNQDGVVQISGITNPMRLLNRIGRWSRLEIQWFQFGQCCSNLYYKPKTAANQSENKLANGHSNATTLPPLAPSISKYRPFNPYAQPYYYKYYY